MGCFGPIAAPIIQSQPFKPHCTVCCTVPFFCCKPLKYIDILAATISSKAQLARSNTKYRRSQSCWAGQISINDWNHSAGLFSIGQIMIQLGWSWTGLGLAQRIPRRFGQLGGQQFCRVNRQTIYMVCNNLMLQASSTPNPSTQLTQNQPSLLE